MNLSKFTIFGVVAAAVLLSANTAFAQASYLYSSGSCTNLAQDLSYGQRGTDVSALQSFLVSQNYPGGGSWMVTGYFGQATVQAVRNFQQAHGLPMTGAVDASTRAAINSASCGTFPGLGGTGYTYNYDYSYQWPYSGASPYTNNYNYGFNYNYGYNNYNQCGTYPYYYPCSNYSSYGTAPHITSFSPTIASPGSTVTVYGTNFDLYSNTVYVGGTTLSGIPSQNGTAITFTMPATMSGSVSVSVGNAYGTSNSLTIQMSGSGYPYNYNYPPYNYPCGYNGYACPNAQTPVVTYLSPQQGAVGASVTVYGYGLSSTGNSVHFGNGIIANLMSVDGRSVSFVVPSSLSGYGYQPIGLGTYQVSVTNSDGLTSNALPFTITSTSQGGNVSITNVSGPSTLGIGVSGTWSITVQNPSSSYLSTSVNWGDSGYYAPSTQQANVYSGSNTLTFSHVYSAGGTYTITFTVSNGAGQSATATASVSVSGTGGQGAVTINSISPTQGSIGTQVAIYGSGFDAYNNTIHFGSGGTMHVPSQNGVIYYTVPSYLSPCDVSSGGICPMYAQQVTSGSYPIYVTSPNGTSNTLSFQVQ